jgi:regulator of sigma E protease
MISLNLAVVNILPFPGLDGWHLLVVGIEAITKKDVPLKFKTIMSVIGLVLLFGLMIFVTVMDIIRMFA